ncbi:MAG: DoxX family protein [Mycobacterium sp.]
MTSTLDARLSSSSSTALGVFRIIVGLLFLAHGASKIFGFPEGPAAPIGAFPGWWSGLLEVVLGALVALGLFTRAAAFLAAGVMAVAYFWVHFPQSFWPSVNGGEAAVLFCFAFLLVIFTGPGGVAIQRR